MALRRDMFTCVFAYMGDCNLLNMYRRKKILDFKIKETLFCFISVCSHSVLSSLVILFVF